MIVNTVQINRDKPVIPTARSISVTLPLDAAKVIALYWGHSTRTSRIQSATRAGFVLTTEVDDALTEIWDKLDDALDVIARETGVRSE